MPLTIATVSTCLLAIALSIVAERTPGLVEPYNHIVWCMALFLLILLVRQARKAGEKL